MKGGGNSCDLDIYNGYDIYHHEENAVIVIHRDRDRSKSPCARSPRGGGRLRRDGTRHPVTEYDRQRDDERRSKSTPCCTDKLGGRKSESRYVGHENRYQSCERHGYNVRAHIKLSKRSQSARYHNSEEESEEKINVLGVEHPIGDVCEHHQKMLALGIDPIEYDEFRLSKSILDPNITASAEKSRRREEKRKNVPVKEKTFMQKFCSSIKGENTRKKHKSEDGGSKFNKLKIKRGDNAMLENKEENSRSPVVNSDPDWKRNVLNGDNPKFEKLRREFIQKQSEPRSILNKSETHSGIKFSTVFQVTKNAPPRPPNEISTLIDQKYKKSNRRPSATSTIIKTKYKRRHSDSPQPFEIVSAHHYILPVTQDSNGLGMTPEVSRATIRRPLTPTPGPSLQLINTSGDQVKFSEPGEMGVGSSGTGDVHELRIRRSTREIPTPPVRNRRRRPRSMDFSENISLSPVPSDSEFSLRKSISCSILPEDKITVDGERRPGYVHESRKTKRRSPVRPPRSKSSSLSSQKREEDKPHKSKRSKSSPADGFDHSVCKHFRHKRRHRVKSSDSINSYSKHYKPQPINRLTQSSDDLSATGRAITAPPFRPCTPHYLSKSPFVNKDSYFYNSPTNICSCPRTGKSQLCSACFEIHEIFEHDITNENCLFNNIELLTSHHYHNQCEISMLPPHLWKMHYTDQLGKSVQDMRCRSPSGSCPIHPLENTKVNDEDKKQGETNPGSRFDPTYNITNYNNHVDNNIECYQQWVSAQQNNTLNITVTDTDNKSSEPCIRTEKSNDAPYVVSPVKVPVGTTANNNLPPTLESSDSEEISYKDVKTPDNSENDSVETPEGNSDCEIVLLKKIGFYIPDYADSADSPEDKESPEESPSLEEESPSLEEESPSLEEESPSPEEDSPTDESPGESPSSEDGEIRKIPPKPFFSESDSADGSEVSKWKPETTTPDLSLSSESEKDKSQENLFSSSSQSFSASEGIVIGTPDASDFEVDPIIDQEEESEKESPSQHHSASTPSRLSVSSGNGRVISTPSLSGSDYQLSVFDDKIPDEILNHNQEVLTEGGDIYMSSTTNVLKQHLLSLNIEASEGKRSRKQRRYSSISSSRSTTFSSDDDYSKSKKRRNKRSKKKAIKKISTSSSSSKESYVAVHTCHTPIQTTSSEDSLVSESLKLPVLEHLSQRKPVQYVDKSAATELIVPRTVSTNTAEEKIVEPSSIANNNQMKELITVLKEMTVRSSSPPVPCVTPVVIQSETHFTSNSIVKEQTTIQRDIFISDSSSDIDPCQENKYLISPTLTLSSTDDVINDVIDSTSEEALISEEEEKEEEEEVIDPPTPNLTNTHSAPSSEDDVCSCIDPSESSSSSYTREVIDPPTPILTNTHSAPSSQNDVSSIDSSESSSHSDDSESIKSLPETPDFSLLEDEPKKMIRSDETDSISDISDFEEIKMKTPSVTPLYDSGSDTGAEGLSEDASSAAITVSEPIRTPEHSDISSIPDPPISTSDEPIIDADEHLSTPSNSEESHYPTIAEKHIKDDWGKIGAEMVFSSERSVDHTFHNVYDISYSQNTVSPQANFGEVSRNIPVSGFDKFRLQKLVRLTERSVSVRLTDR